MNIPQHNSNSLSLVRLIGYGLLAISLVHIIDIFIPPRFTDPDWEFAAATLVLERTPLPLVGLAMVFWGGAESRHKGENLVLPLLSWAALLVGMLYVLLIPMEISAAARLKTQNSLRLNAQYEQQIAQLNEAQERLDNANPEQLNLLSEALREQNSSPELLTPDALKTQLNEELVQARQNADAARQNSQRSQNLGVLKNSAKLASLSLVSAYLFIYAWRLTVWSRQSKGYGKKPRK